MRLPLQSEPRLSGRSQCGIRAIKWSLHFRKKEEKWLKKRLLFSMNGNSNLKAVCIFSSGFQSHLIREPEVTQLLKMVELFYFKLLQFPFSGISLIFVLMYFEGIFFCFCLWNLMLFTYSVWSPSGVFLCESVANHPDLRFAVSIQQTERNIHAFKQKFICQLILCE